MENKERLLARYKELVSKGVCAHAAAAHVMSGSMALDKDGGYSLLEACHRANLLFIEIQGIQDQEETP